MTSIQDMGPDTEIHENERGGKQSAIPYAFHLIDPEALFKLAERLHYGAKKYTRDNWRKIESEEHFNHMIAHAYAYMGGDRSDDHLGAVICRAMMAVAVAVSEEAKASATLTSDEQLKAEINRVMNQIEDSGEVTLTSKILDAAMHHYEPVGQNWPNNIRGVNERPLEPH